ncbi:MAG: XRE family transcriptional regulator [Candidatus Viridilinea halotolerans]|uniref:XRE family transcriptional regulator n=1 Tax=Candidatus Viridilinea halotolerans TaxID=2491704 RepID=A0A426TUL0_9CHLR|nr:MAG: XRE family transcriptional regulator [Candidatus Viridilinea halotolerans]
MSTVSQVDMQVGEAMRKARLSRGLRQDDLADLLGVDRSTIARYERGTRSINVSTLLQVAQVLQRPATTFLPGSSSDQGIHMVMQTLQRHPELLTRVVDLLQVSLAEEEDLMLAAGLQAPPEIIAEDLQPLTEEALDALWKTMPAGTPLSQIIDEDRMDRA